MKKGSCQTRGRPEGATAFTLWPSQLTEPYSWVQGGKQPHSKALQEAKEAHQWALEVAHMLEQSIDRLGRGDYQPKHHSYSWGRIQEWCLPSPSAHRPRGCISFHEPKEETSADEEPQRECSTGEEMGDSDLGLPPTMGPDLKWLMGMPTADRSAGQRGSILSEPSIENYEKWLEWWAWQLDNPHWWEELTAIPDVKDVLRLAWKIWASFEVPSVRMEALEGQPFTVPPCTEVHPKMQAPTRWIVMPAHEDEAPPDDPSICKGTTVLGGESQSASVW